MLSNVQLTCSYQEVVQFSRAGSRHQRRKHVPGQPIERCGGTSGSGTGPSAAAQSLLFRLQRRVLQSYHFPPTPPLGVAKSWSQLCLFRLEYELVNAGTVPY